MNAVLSSPLHKPATTEHAIHPLLSNRWSPRAFAARPIADSTLQQLFEAARWAASAANKQPWRFVVASDQNPEMHARMASVLAEGNRVWAEQAPVLILVAAELYPYPGKEQVSFYDAGMAAANLVTQAVDLGLATHQMGGFDSAAAKSAFNIPDNCVPIAVIALGYPGSLDQLEGVLRERELGQRSRNPQSDFVFWGTWPQAQTN